MTKIFRKFIITITTFLFLINVPILSVLASQEEKSIYLTFDDGPGGKVTTEVLDILKSEQVPATFFLIGNQINGQEKLVKRIADEGHSLGLHSMSHNKNKLYSSNQAFLDEMLESQAVIKEVTGESPNILRFPFGCNNTRYHLKKELVELLHKNNMKIYDWNVDSTDGANHTASPSTYIKKSKSDKNPIVLLMHCGYMNKNSAKALPEIIKFYKDQGYVFKVISNDTAEIFHYLK
ncbi:polysaccharide deacetylase family protein [Clostridium paraputrificum]|uniref:polysaccharide deacetylase family protein n=1 Tax=Clostridium TaxID=1485 RepID=UPI003D3387F4